MKKRLVFASHNAHKVAEVAAILGEEVEIVGLREIGCETDIPETSDTIEGNALQKARYVQEHYGIDCFADDTGLEVEALGGAPGVRSARYGGGGGHDSEANMRRLLKELEGEEHRDARFRTAIVLISGGEIHLFEGIVKGRILREKRGSAGFGYDPLFVPDGFEETFAELGDDVKNRISHRAKAVQLLANFLKREAAGSGTDSFDR